MAKLLQLLNKVPIRLLTQVSWHHICSIGPVDYPGFLLGPIQQPRFHSLV